MNIQRIDEETDEERYLRKQIHEIRLAAERQIAPLLKRLVDIHNMKTPRWIVPRDVFIASVTASDDGRCIRTMFAEPLQVRADEVARVVPEGGWPDSPAAERAKAWNEEQNAKARARLDAMPTWTAPGSSE